MSPEPCLRRDDRCAAPTSCAAWGYCRERNMPENSWPGRAKDEENRAEARRHVVVPDTRRGTVQERALPALRELHAAVDALDPHDLVVREISRAGLGERLHRASEDAADVLEHAIRHAFADGPAAADPRSLEGRHVRGPWTVRPTDGDLHHPFRVEAEAGHVASVACWSRYGQPSPTAAANAALLAAAPALAMALRDLLRWAEDTGGWEGACWDRARAMLAAALGTAEGTQEGEG